MAVVLPCSDGWHQFTRTVHRGFVTDFNIFMHFILLVVYNTGNYAKAKSYTSIGHYPVNAKRQPVTGQSDITWETASKSAAQRGSRQFVEQNSNVNRVHQENCCDPAAQKATCKRFFTVMLHSPRLTATMDASVLPNYYPERLRGDD